MLYTAPKAQHFCNNLNKITHMLTVHADDIFEITFQVFQKNMLIFQKICWSRYFLDNFQFQVFSRFPGISQAAISPNDVIMMPTSENLIDCALINYLSNNKKTFLNTYYRKNVWCNGGPHHPPPSRLFPVAKKPGLSRVKFKCIL